MKNRDVQRYVAIKERLQREALGERVPGLFSKVHEWLAQNSVVTAGPPLIRYLVIDYNSGQVEIDAGVPVASAVPDHARIHPGKIPGGLYATVIHQGSYVDLMDTTAKLLAWGKEHNIRWQMTEESKVIRWSGRIEHYLVGPTANPNPEDWRTEIAILLAGSENRR